MYANYNITQYIFMRTHHRYIHAFYFRLSSFVLSFAVAYFILKEDCSHFNSIPLKYFHSIGMAKICSMFGVEEINN